MALTDRRKRSMAIKWIIAAARARKGKPMCQKLYEEISDAVSSEVSWSLAVVDDGLTNIIFIQGVAFKKKIELHKMAEGNRAYAHLRWT